MQERTPDASARAQPPELDAETYGFAQKVFTLVRSGDTEILGPFLQQGLPANLCNHRGDSLLMLASYHGHLDTARLLLQHGADPEIRNDHGQTPLAGAAFKGDVPMVELLLTHGANIEAATPDGKTPLMMAAMFNRMDVMEVLLARGADPQAQDARGMGAFEAAQAMGASDTAARLQQLRQ